jgi:hypothetical protein
MRVVKDGEEATELHRAADHVAIRLSYALASSCWRWFEGVHSVHPRKIFRRAPVTGSVEIAVYSLLRSGSRTRRSLMSADLIRSAMTISAVSSGTEMRQMKLGSRGGAGQKYWALSSAACAVWMICWARGRSFLMIRYRYRCVLGAI